MSTAVSQLLSRLQRAADVCLPRSDTLLATVDSIEVSPRAFAFREGTRNAYIYVVRQGLLKQYYTDEHGGEWTKSFTAEGSVFACLDALHGGVTSFASEAIEPSIVERIPFAPILRLADEHREWQRVLSTAYEYLARLKIKRERELLMYGAEELYARLASESSELCERVPQKDLAAYLGVTAVGLNGIKRHTARSSAM